MFLRRYKNNMTAPVYSVRVQRFCENSIQDCMSWSLLSTATGNALAKVTSLQGTEEEERRRGKEKVSREGGTEDSKHFQ